MKMKIIAPVLISLVIVGMLVASKLKLEETTVSARFEMNACEGCYHMTVEKSKTSSLLEETIIPVSNTINVEQIIEDIVISKEPACLRGKPYRFNWNFFKIDPEGVQFEVIEKLPLLACSGL